LASVVCLKAGSIRGQGIHAHENPHA